MNTLSGRQVSLFAGTGEGERSWTKSFALWLTLAVVSGSLSLLYGLSQVYSAAESSTLLLAEELATGGNPYHYSDSGNPGVYFLHAVWVSLFGHHAWSGRLLSWILMIVASWLTASALPRSVQTPARRWVGLLTFLLLWACGGNKVAPEAGVAVLLAAALAMLSNNSLPHDTGRGHICSPEERFVSFRSAAWSGTLFALAASFSGIALLLPFAYLTVILMAVGHRVSAVRAGGAVVLHLFTFLFTTGALWMAYWITGVAEEIWLHAISLPAVGSISFETLFFQILPGILISIPIISLPLSRAKDRKWRESPLAFQFCSIAALGAILAFIWFVNVKYLLAAVPAFAVMCYDGWGWYVRPWLEHRPGLRFQLAYLFLALCGVLVISGFWLKRNNAMQLAGFPGSSPAYIVAFELGRYVSSPGDRVLLIDTGPGAIGPESIYYYAGLRPAVPQVGLIDASPDVAARNSARLSALVLDPSLKVVLFDPDLGFEPAHRPVPEHASQMFTIALMRHFDRAPQLGPTTWVRKGLEAGPANIYRGPFSNRVWRRTE